MIKQMTEIVGASRVFTKEPMSKHTTFRIGGEADVLVEPASIAETEAVIRVLRGSKTPYMIMGNGSNILVGDKGIRGVVVKLGNEFAAASVEGTTLIAQSGIKLSRLANLALEKELTGLEFAAGIPGTLGGAIYMNAGAYGGEIKQVIKEVTYLDADGEKKTIANEECKFGYRTSIFGTMPGSVILGCKIELTQGDGKEIRAVMEDLAQRRVSKQPLNLPSAGSTFKRPEGHFAGKLIQDAGLTGFRVGGACVSEKHAGFVVNDQGATASDVRELISKVQEKVKAQFGVTLEPEVKFVGEF